MQTERWALGSQARAGPLPRHSRGKPLSPSPRADKCHGPRKSAPCHFCRPSCLSAPRGSRGRPLKHVRDKEHSPRALLLQTLLGESRRGCQTKVHF